VVSVKAGIPGQNPLLDSMENKNRKSTPAKKRDDNMLAYRKSTDALKGFDRSFFTMDENFRSGIADRADLHIWTEQPNTLAMLKKMNPANMFSMMQEINDSAFKHGNKMFASIRFDNGRITIDSKNVITPALHAFSQKLNARPMNMDLMKKIPAKNVLGFFSISFDPTIVSDLLGNGKTRKKTDSLLAAKNMTLDDVIGAFRGDFLLLAVNPPETDSLQKPRIYFGATINNPESLHKWITAMKNADERKGKNSFDKLKAAYNAKENIFGISSSQESADAFVNGETANTTALLTDKMKNNSFNIAVDFKTINDLLNKATGDISPKVKSFAGMLKILDKLIITRGSYANNISETHVELTMTDDSENSLRTLMKLFAGGK
ncbi:MAG TPA: DUF4836 family protein, partial [Puia sp.]|nr:DUF4836 family protein [Puia sp.]